MFFIWIIRYIGAHDSTFVHQEIKDALDKLTANYSIPCFKPFIIIHISKRFTISVLIPVSLIPQHKLLFLIFSVIIKCLAPKNVAYQQLISMTIGIKINMILTQRVIRIRISN